MQIEITKINGSCQSFNGEIEYSDTYIAIKYISTVDVTDPWIIIVIPWRFIYEIEVRP